MTDEFHGWPAVAIEFYRGLEADNSKAYWTAHKDTFDRHVRAPFDALSEQVATEFGELHVFRPYRDVRFSKDKSPYKTRCYGVAEGEGGERYYVGISAAGLSVGAGYWMMARDQLERYRSAVDSEATGTELAGLVAAALGDEVRVETQGLKTAPRGWPRDHPRIELLRAKSLALVSDFAPDPWLATSEAGHRITAAWRNAGPVNRWLATHVGPSEEPPDSRW